ncbi:hypothetical protein SteCoe_19383 [Stentor coeruleus]|uniref:C2 NT-type domain-containing protein n=1 Tax=Stentor coeruleus TaxID=5963 RepID=A0A1R2BUB2_9CILI|nr:hypothetical protein SteCoe_19383 [Stentor coeruleus]
MEYLKRIVTISEKFFLEIYLHSVHISLPKTSEIQIVVKRSKNKKQKTPKYIHEHTESICFFECNMNFPVTLYKDTRGYNEKKYYFRLLQTKGKKAIKNGKARLDLSTLISKPAELIDLPLNNCSDPKAYIIISASLEKAHKTVSCSSFIPFYEPVSPEKIPQRSSNSFDNTILYQKLEEKKKKAKEKYYRRIEKVNSIHSSPNSARIIEDSDVSSCASPLSPLKSPESPERADSLSDDYTFFTIKPIKIEYLEDEILKNNEIDTEISTKNEEIMYSHDKIVEVNEEESSEFEKHSIEENSEFEKHSIEESSVKYDDKEISQNNLEEDIQNEEVTLPYADINEAKANYQQKENKIESAEIGQEEKSSDKCCKCTLF